MLIETLKHTPPWVFILFYALLTLGYLQSMDKVVGRAKLVGLPLAMIALSLYGVISTFGIGPIGVISWMPAVTVGISLGMNLFTPDIARFSSETQSFAISGSWTPLGLMMAIYFIKYGVGVILARELPIANEPVFISAISACYGLLGGMFLGRAYAISRSAHSNTPLLE